MTSFMADRPLIQIAMDISVSGKDDRYLAYGVVSSDMPRLDMFNDEWYTFLEKHQISYLKVSEAIAFRGEFESKRSEWGASRGDKRDQLVVEAAEIVARRLSAGGASIDFTQVISGQPLPSEKLIRFKKVSLFALALSSLTRDSPYNFAFLCDEEQDVARQFLKYVDRFKRENNLVDRITGLCFCNDKALPVLQAADLVAHVLRQGRTGQPSPLESILFPGEPEKRSDIWITWPKSIFP